MEGNMKLLNCVLYFAVTGIGGFLLGRLIPKSWLRPEGCLFRTRAFEKDGKLYDRLKVRFWQNKLPDMSRILPRALPAKKMTGDYQQRLPRMIQETCAAELTHLILCVTGLYCLRLMPGLGGVIVYVLYAGLFNLPYIIIQRYNRPRFQRLSRRLQEKNREEGGTENACPDFKLQHRRGT